MRQESQYRQTSAVVDNLLTVMLVGGVLATGLAAPNMMQVLDKPLQRYFNRLDKRIQERELRRVLAYMKRRGLVRRTSDDYEHGLIITAAGKRRAKQAAFSNLRIDTPAIWDQRWRIVLFDIPESKRSARRALTGKLHTLGFRPLQQSAWIHPFPCREVIETITLTYGLSRYVSYLETDYIDNQSQLVNKFSHLLSPSKPND